jgi:hypothetical protein
LVIDRQQATKCLGGLASLAQRAQAAGADVEPQTDAVDDDALLVHIWPEIPVRAALRETHIVAKRLGFSTNITLPGHNRPPFDNCIALEREFDPVSDLGQLMYARLDHAVLVFARKIGAVTWTPPH